MPDSFFHSDEAPVRTAWQRRILDPIIVQLTQGITPEKVALTLAVGSALALFPILGTTTLLCLIVGVTLRLNQPIIQILNACCTPFHLPAILGLVELGNRLFGESSAHVGIRMMNHMFWDNPAEFFERFGLTALHAIVAWAVLAPGWILIVYCTALAVLKEVARRRGEGVARLEPIDPPEHPVP